MGVEVTAVEEASYCDDCPLKANPYVIGYGYSKSPFLVVGTAPGETEERCGIAFTGKHGQLVRDLIEDLGVDLEDVYFTNVLKRRPVDDAGTNRKPTKRECWKCGSHLVNEIVRNRPRVVLTLGSIPLTFLANLPSSFAVSTVRGLPLPVQRFRHEFVVVPTHDPAYVSRKGGLLSAEGDSFVSDIEEFVRRVRLSDV